MSKAQTLTRAEASILAKMAVLEPETPRYQVLDAALSFKASWVILGEHLANVVQTRLWRGWGYASFEQYCSNEVQITASTAKKLVRCFAWLDAEAPEHLPPRNDGKLMPTAEAPSLPDLGAIHVVASAHRYAQQSNIPEETYLSLKQAAFDGESAGALRRALKDALPATDNVDDGVRHLRRALSACVKVIDALRQWDIDGNANGDDVLLQAEALRDTIALRLPRPEEKLETQSETT